MKIQEIPRRTFDFNQVYDSANAAQKQAIDRTDGAVLVVAGPGTGKTQIIATRIARIMQQGNQPENILCLTYTDAGTIAMRDRLLEFIGPDAYRINIFTFHSFCNMVIQENPSIMGYGDLKPVSELEKREFVKQVLDSLPHDNPLAREKGDLYSDSRNLLSLYADIKREDWGLEEMTAGIDRHIAQLPDDPAMRYTRKYTNKATGITYLPGDIKQAQVDAETRKYSRLRAAILSYPVYQQVMADNRRYDFDDMILWVIREFRQSPDLLVIYQERYHYLLVDEYQDTSGAQNEIVDLLMSYWDDPNLFVVGDDDQSIYRFQGANIANLLAFHERYRPYTVTLIENYRSTRQILEAATALVANNRQRLANREQCPDIAIDKGLQANRPDGEKPEIRAYPNILQESLGVAVELELLHRQGDDLGSVAVLYRNHRQAEQLVRYLTARGIPYSTKKRTNILVTPLIGQLLDLLKYLCAEFTKPHAEERLLFRILHYPVFGLAPLEIARLYAGSSSRSGGRKPVRELLEVSEKGSAFKSASDLIEGSLSRMVTVPLQEFIHEVMTRFGLLREYESAEKTVWNFELLNTFFDFVKDECSRNPKLDLEQLIRLVELMESQEIELQAERIACEQNGVNLITTHSSKGLEFETVYMMGCNEGEWEKKRAPASFAAPPTLAVERVDDGDIEEDRRLFFVAMTRAKTRLVITYAQRDNNDKQIARSRFVAELERSDAVVSISCQFEQDELSQAMGAIIVEQPEDGSDIFRSDLVGELLKEYRLSVTHLNDYLKCPRSFFFTRILRVPAPRNAAMAFGTSVHESLEFLFSEMTGSGTERFPAKGAFLERFSREMERHRDSFTDVEFDRRLKVGTENLARYYDENVGRWHRDVRLEKNYEAVLNGEIRINGLVDKLEILPGKLVNLVDYKTGRHDRKKFQPPDPERAEKAIGEGKEPKFEDLNGGDYWRQAVFYKILVENSPKESYVVSTAEFSFVEPDKASGEFITQRVEIGQQDIDTVRRQIETVYARIMNREFGDGCTNSYCEWCNGRGSDV